MCLWHVEDASVEGYFEIIFSVVVEKHRWRQVGLSYVRFTVNSQKNMFTTTKNTKAYHGALF